MTVLGLEELRSFTASNHGERRSELDAVAAIVEEEIARYLRDKDSRTVAPLVIDLRDKAESIRMAELARFENRLETLNPDQRAAVEQLTKAMLAKVLHEPTVRLRSAAGTPEGDRLVSAMRHLLDL